MATIYNTNVVPGSHWDTVYQWKNFMKTAGWTVPLSGTGNSGTSGASDLITSATIMSNQQAWFVLRDGDGVRSFCFQTGSGDHVWRVKYSAAAGFTGGTANTQPAATDEVLLIGTGTDGSPGFVSLFAFLAGGSRKVQMIADTAAPWSFYMMSYPAGTGPDTVFMLDGLLGPPAGDPDPVVVGIVFGSDSGGVFQYNTNSFGNIATGDSEPFAFAGWMAKGQAGQRFSRVVPLFYCSGNGGQPLWPANGSSNSGGVNPNNGKDILLPLMWARDVSRTGPGGYKGLSRWLQFNGALRSFSDLISVSSPGAGDYLHVSQGVVVPWNGVAIV